MASCGQEWTNAGRCVLRGRGRSRKLSPGAHCRVHCESFLKAEGFTLEALKRSDEPPTVKENTELQRGEKDRILSLFIPARLRAYCTMPPTPQAALPSSVCSWEISHPDMPGTVLH